MTDNQFNACERIDTHPRMPMVVWTDELVREMGCADRNDLQDVFKYAMLMPSQDMLSIDTWCRWYRGEI
jgi:hypothetical protein